MRCLFAALALVALVSAGPVGQPFMPHHEALDLFFSSLGARQQFADAARALGVPMGEDVQRALSPPWARAGSGGLAAIQEGMDDGGLDALIETLRRLIETVAEPLKIEKISLNSSSSLVQSVGYIRDASVSKLSTFKVESLKYDLFSLSIAATVSFDKLDAHGYYNVDATASGQLHVFGDGHFDVRLRQPTVEVQIRIGYGKKHFTIEDLEINVKLAKLKVVMSNFLGGGEVGDLVCGIVSDVGPAFLDEYHDDISNTLSTEIKSTVNALLDKIDINTIIDWIAGGGSSN